MWFLKKKTVIEEKQSEKEVKQENNNISTANAVILNQNPSEQYVDEELYMTPFDKKISDEYFEKIKKTSITSFNTHKKSIEEMMKRLYEYRNWAISKGILPENIKVEYNPDKYFIPNLIMTDGEREILNLYNNIGCCGMKESVFVRDFIYKVYELTDEKNVYEKNVNEISNLVKEIQ